MGYLEIFFSVRKEILYIFDVIDYEDSPISSVTHLIYLLGYMVG